MLYAIPGLMPPRRRNSEARILADRTGSLKITLGVISNNNSIPPVKIWVRDLLGNTRYFDASNTDIFTREAVDGFQELYTVLPNETITETPCHVIVIVGNDAARRYISERSTDSMVDLTTVRSDSPLVKVTTPTPSDVRSLYFISGDTNKFRASIVVDGAPVNIDSAELWFTAKYNITDADENAAFQKTIGNGITVVDATLGRILITITPADTASIAHNTQLFYDLQIKTNIGEVFTVDAGKVIIVGDVTQST